MHPIFYFIFFFLALGVYSLIAKTIAMMRSASGVSAMDVSDLLACVFLTGFPSGLLALVLEGEKSRSLAPGFEVLAVAAVAMAVSLVIRSRAGGGAGASPQAVDVATLERRKEITGNIGRYFGLSPKAIDTGSASSASQWKKVPGLFFVPFIMFGAIGLGFGGMSLWQGIRCKSWPHTDGVITSSNIERHHSTGRHSHDVWGVKISYDYKVAGVSYTGTRVAFGMEESSAAHAQSFVVRYPPGKSVPVFYSPGDPESAVLETGVFGGVFIWLGVGGLFLVVGIGGLAVRHRKLKTLELMTAA
jgi:hypothetical protein